MYVGLKNCTDCEMIGHKFHLPCHWSCVGYRQNPTSDATLQPCNDEDNPGNRGIGGSCQRWTDEHHHFWHLLVARIGLRTSSPKASCCAALIRQTVVWPWIMLQGPPRVETQGTKLRNASNWIDMMGCLKKGHPHLLGRGRLFLTTHPDAHESRRWDVASISSLTFSSASRNGITSREKGSW